MIQYGTDDPVDATIGVDTDTPQENFHERAFQDSVLPFVDIDTNSDVLLSDGSSSKVHVFDYVEETRNISAKISEVAKVFFVFDPNPIVNGKWRETKLAKYNAENLTPMLESLRGKTVYIYFCRRVEGSKIGQISLFLGE